MKRVVFLNRYFFPDHCATSQILSDLAFDLALAGLNVHVVTSRQLYDSGGACLAAEEAVAGVQIHRIRTAGFTRSTLIGRGIEYLSFYFFARRALIANLAAGDVVVAMTDPPLVSVIALSAAAKRQALLVNWLQDVYPEVAAQLGIRFLRGPIGRALRGLRDKTLSRAACNIVVGDQMAEVIARRGAPPCRIKVIPNWTDDQGIQPVAHADNPLRHEWDVSDKFVVGYSGNLGRAHEFETVLGTAEILRAHPRIVFLFVGGGHNFEALRSAAKRRDLANFRFAPYQARTSLKYSLGVADVHWVSLRPALEGLIVPSKVYGIAAAARPIIAVTAKDGEVARMVEAYRCGAVVEPNDSRALADIVLALSADEEACANMGRRARAMLDCTFTRKHAVQAWQDTLKLVSA